MISFVERYAELLKKLTGAKGGEPVDRLAPEIMPSLDLDSASSCFEFRWLGGKISFDIFEQVAAGGAGNFGKVLVFVPLSSGVIVVLEDVITDKDCYYKFVGNITAGYTQDATMPQADDMRATGAKVLQVWTRNNDVTQASPQHGISFSKVLKGGRPLGLLQQNTGLLFSDTAPNDLFTVHLRGYLRAVDVQEK